ASPESIHPRSQAVKWIPGSSFGRPGMTACVEARAATNQPDGQITKSLSSASRKNKSLNPSGKSVI
ncbi:hypothetical protein, partial [Bradyrhizobium sp. Leo170]|uniref:hypothetical protein n=1 Tax=Bradyrhizobium sp. Leo170 TaxID=1571199 RepID=UPI001A91AFAD